MPRSAITRHDTGWCSLPSTFFATTARTRLQCARKFRCTTANASVQTDEAKRVSPVANRSMTNTLPFFARVRIWKDGRWISLKTVEDAIGFVRELPEEIRSSSQWRRVQQLLFFRRNSGSDGCGGGSFCLDCRSPSRRLVARGPVRLTFQNPPAFLTRAYS
jgi:hypothetical protein